MGSVRLRTLEDYCRHHANVMCECTCGHVGVIEIFKLRRWFFCHRWNDAIENVYGRVYCSVCRGRPRLVRACQKPPTGPPWGPQYEDDWRRLVRRLR